MNLFVLLALVLDVLPDDVFVAVSADRVHVVSARPEMPSPEKFLDLWMEAEQLF